MAVLVGMAIRHRTVGCHIIISVLIVVNAGIVIQYVINL